MTPHPIPSPSARLARLQRYLQEDPGNAALLADACDAAIEAGAHEQALAHLAAAQRLALDPAAWTFRRARLCIARRELAEARSLLDGLRDAGQPRVVAHDLAWIALLEGDCDRCRQLLQDWLEDDRAPAGERAAIQALWLRATHHLGQAREGLDWARASDARGALLPQAQGVASLLAIDADDFTAAKTLADAALAAGQAPVEALVARATVAVAEGEAARATALLQQALERSPDDGRTWSALGLASLQARDFAAAQAQFERALLAIPGHIGTWHALGWARLLQDDAQGALLAFRSALERDANFAESHGAVGLLLALRGDRIQAARHLEIADRLDRRNVTGRYARALLNGEAGDAQRVQALALRLLERPGLFGGRLGDAVVAAIRTVD